ncbi:MAG: SHOCT domain-containing protein [Anaerolineae bacterium]|nr:SHOCT domain-containing protein [Anaerolineae bacterium]
MMGFGMGGLGLILMFLFWGAIIALAVWLLSSLFPRAKNISSPPYTAQRDEPSQSPLEILKQRYARGEISKTEYEEMRQGLEA